MIVSPGSDKEHCYTCSFSRFDHSERKNILSIQDHNYFIEMPRWSPNKVLVYFGYGYVTRFYSSLQNRCILRKFERPFQSLKTP